MSAADSFGTAKSGSIGRLEAVGWGIAGLVALSLHASILWATQRTDESEGHTDLPEAVIIELAPPSAAQEPIEEVAAEVPEAVPVPAEPEPEPIQEEITEAPEPTPQPEPAPEPEPVQEEITEEPEPEPVPQPQEASAPAETATPAEPEIADLATPAENIPLPIPRPALGPITRPEPVKRVAEKPAQAVKPVRKKEAQKAPPAAKTASARAEQARPKPSAAAAAPSLRRQAPAVSPARWQSKLVAYLNRHKRYPRAARSRKEEGTAQLAFTIDASGNVLSARIARSSGSPELDGEVLAMIRRASPLPAPPEAIARSRMDLSVPISFKLR